MRSRFASDRARDGTRRGGAGGSGNRLIVRDAADTTRADVERAWDARLDLGFARAGERTLLARRAHRGPLVVQKTLHPEGPRVCQAIVVHPPGGIAGGDRLALAIDVGENAHAQLTTPGAAKWYRSAGADARQSISARVAGGATLEWLPQETIIFDSARAELATKVTLARDAVFIGWDVVCLGRTASGERFRHGRFRQCFELVREGVLAYTDRAVLDGDDMLLDAPVGLNGCTMFGTFVIAAPSLADDLVAACRSATAGADELDIASTRLPEAIVVRCRGRSAEAARSAFARVWTVVRPALVGRAALAPRIWNT